jgi:MerR family copper efflux transcriptional regulator
LTLEPVPELTLCSVKDEVLTGELARMCGVSADTIRHYERVGVLPAAVRGANGYRYHPAATAGRVRLIRRALAIGFSLAELARILRQRDGGTPPCRGVRALAGEKLDELDRRIGEMTAMRAELAGIVEEWDERLAATRDGEPALLLEQLQHRKERNDDEELDPVSRSHARLAARRR